MKITDITLWKVSLASHVVYQMSGQKRCAAVDSIVVRLTTDTGMEGWGEVCPIPHYLPAYANGVAAAVKELSPVLLGGDPLGPEALEARMDNYLKGHVYAKSALDIALWDLNGKAFGVPLYALMGGLRAARLPTYHSITCIDPEAMAEIAAEAFANGIRQFQVKLGSDSDWERDARRVQAVRETVGDGPLVYCDWNCGATRLQATRTVRAIRDMDVMIEQPCATLEDCAAVRAASGLPMKIDELAHDAASLLDAHRLGILDAVALKLSKFGGLSALRRARDLCLHLGPEMCIEDTWGSDIAMCAALHLAAATPVEMVLNVCDLAGYVSPRIAPDAPSRAAGMIEVPNGPGLGITPDATVLGDPIAVFSDPETPALVPVAAVMA